MPSAPNEQEKGGLGSVPGILAVLLMTAGAIWVQTPLEGQRPPPTSAGLRLAGVQDVDARLWQDPFSAVVKAREQADTIDYRDAVSRFGAARPRQSRRGATQGRAPEGLANEISAALLPKQSEVVVLGVLVFGSTFVGAEEYRRRTRYAVLSALKTGSYLPVDVEHIGYVDTADMPESGPGFPEVVPFEWFEHERRESKLLVLWLDESSLLESAPSAKEGEINGPLKRLARVLTPLVGDEPWERLRINLIGPAGSDMLLESAAELRRYRKEKAGFPPVLRRVSVLSPFATIPDKTIRDEYWADEKAHRRDERCAQRPCRADDIFRADYEGGGAGFDFFGRMTPGDDVVMSAVFKELGQRCLRQSDHIAIVGEWDTKYARQLSSEIRNLHVRPRENLDGQAVKAGLEPVRFDRDAAHSAGHEVKSRSQTVHKFGYMRGLDGRQPDPRAAAADLAKQGDKEKQGGKSVESKRLERPEGDTQIDYLRRLALLMKVQEDRLQIQPGETEARPFGCDSSARFRAIGIVGNDYYDKLLVLQALRPAFPEAQFFTTDLDAAMLHDMDNIATRNLVVGSGFGLTLHPNLQDGTPPFRDSYQTATYLAVRVALSARKGSGADDPHGRAGAHWPPSKEVADRWLEPRVWEVGRTRFHPLSAPPAAAECHGGPLHCLNPYDEGLPAPAVNGWAIAAALAAAAAFMLLASGKLREWLWLALRNRWTYIAVAPALGLIVAYLIVPAIEDASSPGGEPMAWFEGISIWPSNMIRALAFVCAVGALIFAVQSIRERLRQTDERFFPGDAAAAGLPGDRIDPGPVWRGYKENMAISRIAKSALLEWLALMVFFSALWAVFGSAYVPARSAISYKIHIWAVMLPVFATQFLLVFVTVAVRHTNRLAAALSRETRWPDGVRKRFGLPVSTQPAHFDDWLDLQVIAWQSETVNSLLYFPFICLLLLLLARNRIFDNWSWSPALLIVFAVSFLYLILSALRLRWTAERARENALRALQRKLLVLQAEGVQNGAALAEQCRTLIAHMTGLTRGAFLPFSQQPVVRAILALAGGLSGAALLEYATLANF